MKCGEDVRFKLVEELLIEERGQTELRDFICELLNRLCKSTLSSNQYELHHKDFYHDNNDPRNLVLLPKGSVTSSAAPYRNFIKPNTSIHKNVPNMNVFNKADVNNYKSIINNYSGIDVYRSIQNHRIVYLDDVKLNRDLNIAKKNPAGRIR